MTKIEKEIEDILSGAGWCTDNYILNFYPHLSHKEKHALMIQLAVEGLLFDEEAISEKDLSGSGKPKNGKVTVKWVVDTYKFLTK